MTCETYTISGFATPFCKRSKIRGGRSNFGGDSFVNKQESPLKIFFHGFGSFVGGRHVVHFHFQFLFCKFSLKSCQQSGCIRMFCTEKLKLLWLAPKSSYYLFVCFLSLLKTLCTMNKNLRTKGAHKRELSKPFISIKNLVTSFITIIYKLEGN